MEELSRTLLFTALCEDHLLMDGSRLASSGTLSMSESGRYLQSFIVSQLPCVCFSLVCSDSLRVEDLFYWFAYSTNLATKSQTNPLSAISIPTSGRNSPSVNSSTANLHSLSAAPGGGASSLIPPSGRSGHAGKFTAALHAVAMMKAKVGEHRDPTRSRLAAGITISEASPPTSSHNAGSAMQSAVDDDLRAKGNAYGLTAAALGASRPTDDASSDDSWDSVYVASESGGPAGFSHQGNLAVLRSPGSVHSHSDRIGTNSGPIGAKPTRSIAVADPSAASKYVFLLHGIDLCSERTQSALMEVFANKCVVVNGKCIQLPRRSMIVATIAFQPKCFLVPPVAERFLASALLPTDFLVAPVTPNRSISSQEYNAFAEKMDKKNPFLMFDVEHFCRQICVTLRTHPQVDRALPPSAHLLLLRFLKAYQIVMNSSRVPLSKGDTWASKQLTPDVVRALCPAVLSHRIRVRRCPLLYFNQTVIKVAAAASHGTAEPRKRLSVPYNRGGLHRSYSDMTEEDLLDDPDEDADGHEGGPYTELRLDAEPQKDQDVEFILYERVTRYGESLMQFAPASGSIPDTDNISLPKYTFTVSSNRLLVEAVASSVRAPVWKQLIEFPADAVHT
eukprot:ANDGO_08073.mRNA.1 hypothetical protein